MTFREKLAKALRPRTYTQSRVVRSVTHFGEHYREWQRRRAAERVRRQRQLLTVENLRRGIDAEAFKTVQALEEIKDRPDVFWTKYLDVDHWLAVNIKHAEELGLLANPPRDLLDIGCGAGYFMLVCRALGARVIGIDVNSDQVLNRMIKLFGLQRVTQRIRAFVKLPDLKRRFDLITGFMICFNFPTNETYWNEDEWHFFLNDLLRFLKPGGRVFLSLNKQPDGELYSEALKRYFESRGAVVNGKRMLFTRDGLKRTANSRPVALLERVS